VTRGCLEAVLIRRVLDEPDFWCSDALIDRERLAQVPGGVDTVAGKLTAAEAGQRPGFLRRCARLDRLGQRLAVNLAGLLVCRRPGRRLAGVRTGRAKSGKASGMAGERLGGARQAGGRMSGTGCLAAGRTTRDDRRRGDAP
jgi:hypothetical protein